MRNLDLWNYRTVPNRFNADQNETSWLLNALDGPGARDSQHASKTNRDDRNRSRAASGSPSTYHFSRRNDLAQVHCQFNDTEIELEKSRSRGRLELERGYAGCRATSRTLMYRADAPVAQLSDGEHGHTKTQNNTAPLVRREACPLGSKADTITTAAVRAVFAISPVTTSPASTARHRPIFRVCSATMRSGVLSGCAARRRLRAGDRSALPLFDGRPFEEVRILR